MKTTAAVAPSSLGLAVLLCAVLPYPVFRAVLGLVIVTGLTAACAEAYRRSMERDRRESEQLRRAAGVPTSKGGADE